MADYGDALWLKVAKALPVGSSIRTQHGSEARANLVVTNGEGKWHAWCFRCNKGWVQRKTHVTLGRGKKLEKKDYKVLPPDLTQRIPAEHLVKRLMRFGVYERSSWHTTMYSPMYARLYILHGNSWSSRTVRDDVAPKWVHSHPMTMLGCGHITDSLVIVEDVISAIKVSQSLQLLPNDQQMDVLCTHGTGLSDTHVEAIASYSDVVLMYDGDKAGQGATCRNARKLRPFVAVHPVHLPQGNDPKDIPRHEIVKILESTKCEH